MVSDEDNYLLSMGHTQGGYPWEAVRSDGLCAGLWQDWPFEICQRTLERRAEWKHNRVLDQWSQHFPYSCPLGSLLMHCLHTSCQPLKPLQSSGLCLWNNWQGVGVPETHISWAWAKPGPRLGIISRCGLYIWASHQEAVIWTKTVSTQRASRSGACCQDLVNRWAQNSP